MKHRWQRVKDRQIRHADDWLMTYADTITLLLCFFAIFLSVSIPKKDIQKKIDVPPGIEVPVKLLPPAAPDAIEGNLPFHGLTHVEQPDVTMEGNLPFHDPETADEADDEPAPTVGTAKAEDITPASEPVALAPLLQSVPSESLMEIANHLKVEANAHVEQKGDRLTSIQVNSAAFFTSGSAVLSASGKTILQAVARNLKSDAYKDYQITVEGHTDDSPINTPQFPSNWELSTSRASAVVHFFLEQGIPAQRLRAAGYADTFPLAPNRDAKGNALPENQARNRRVVIKLEKIEKVE